MCNLKKPEMCPLKGQCLEAALIHYDVTVAVEKEKKEEEKNRKAAKSNGVILKTVWGKSQYLGLDRS